MNTIRSVLVILSVLAGYGCASTPRVSTEGERSAAMSLLNVAATGIGVAVATGKIPEADAKMATDQLQALRDRVTASATTPMSWAELLSDITAFSASWAIAKAK